MLSFEESGNKIECKFSEELTTTVCSDIEKELNEKIADFIKRQGSAEVVFDLAGILYICSSFLHLCLYHCKTAGPSNFRIINVTPMVMNTLSIAGFTEIMTITVP